eukprot:TRINITY_DN8084_c0_g1_i1.p1 TRINITY_DN8084_c0_g1~~TRINITY_DN8084_c0_g1_i1.p1  ORF type:complete len:259 (+),score=38.05 TRINITY_DN8084_c0_g1_i1:53-778(+)
MELYSSLKIFYANNDKKIKIVFLIVALLITYYLVKDRYAHARELGKHVYYLIALYTPFIRDPSDGAMYRELDIPEYGCVFDVGANDGVWASNSYYLVHHMGYKAFLFEPDYEMLSLLYRMYAHNDKVEIYNFGLSHTDHYKKMKKFPTSLENTVEGKTGQYDKQYIEMNIPLLSGSMICDLQKQHECDFSIISADMEGHQAPMFSVIDCDFDIIVYEGEINIPGCEMLFKKVHNTIYRCQK